jgi:L-lactate dehydrogenase
LKAGIIGVGLVGVTAACALVLRGAGRQIVPLGRDNARAQAEANDPQHIHAYVIGDHGDLEVIPWSLISVGCHSVT